MSKLRPGVCGLCGRAVLQPRKDPVPGWNLPMGDRPEWNCPPYGRLHEADGRLERVRCKQCAHLSR